MLEGLGVTGVGHTTSSKPTVGGWSRSGGGRSPGGGRCRSGSGGGGRGGGGSAGTPVDGLAGGGSGGGRGSPGSRSGGRGGGSRGGGSGSRGGTTTTTALLQVLLEGRSGGDGLAFILVLEGVGVTGVGHTTGSKPAEKSGALTGNNLGVEGGGASDEGESNNLHGGYVLVTSAYGVVKGRNNNGRIDTCCSSRAGWLMRDLVRIFSRAVSSRGYGTAKRASPCFSPSHTSVGASETEMQRYADDNDLTSITLNLPVSETSTTVASHVESIPRVKVKRAIPAHAQNEPVTNQSNRMDFLIVLVQVCMMLKCVSVTGR